MSKRNWKKPINAFLSASLIASLVLPAMPTKAVAATSATDLIISEYIEGGNFNKAIELYNGTGKAVDLSAYSLEGYMNGNASSPLKVNLTGSLDHGKTYVINHKDAHADIKSKGNQVDSNVINFNGDDAIVLKKQMKSLIPLDK